MQTVRAYGAGMTGGQFQPGVFLRKPAVILRIFALVREMYSFFFLIEGYASYLNYFINGNTR